VTSKEVDRGKYHIPAIIMLYLGNVLVVEEIGEKARIQQTHCKKTDEKIQCICVHIFLCLCVCVCVLCIWRPEVNIK
jgi:hypothetical protein